MPEILEKRRKAIQRSGKTKSEAYAIATAALKREGKLHFAGGGKVGKGLARLVETLKGEVARNAMTEEQAARSLAEQVEKQGLTRRQVLGGAAAAGTVAAGHKFLPKLADDAGVALRAMRHPVANFDKDILGYLKTLRDVTIESIVDEHSLRGSPGKIIDDKLLDQFEQETGFMLQKFRSQSKDRSLDDLYETEDIEDYRKQFYEWVDSKPDDERELLFGDARDMEVWFDELMEVAKGD